MQRRRKAWLHTANGGVMAAGLLIGLAPALAYTGPGTAGPDLAALQKRIQRTARRAIPSVVRIHTGSGVIVSPDGLILSQYHVIHLPFPQAKPGSEIAVSLADGKKAKAVLLGADPLYDLAALKLTGSGPYPHSPLAEVAPQLGDAVLKLGHPVGGPIASRPPVVRLGRILVRTENQFICDCLVNGGDSGGPFIDLDGRVVGLQGPAGIGVNWPTANEPREKAEVDRLDKRANYFDTARAAPFLSKRLSALKRGKVLQATVADREEKRAGDVALALASTLPVEQWGLGKQALAGFRNAKTSGCVVEVLGWGDRAIALGTVVDSAGSVLTAAVPGVAETSSCPGKLRCRLPSGHTLAAKVIGIDPAYNFALLRVKADGLRPVTWAAGKDPPAGTLLAATGRGVLPIGTGVVSVSRRRVIHPHPVRLGQRPAESPELSLVLPPDRRVREFRWWDWDFYPPVALESDLPLLPREYGCPVVGLDGKAVGVVVGRIAPQACLIVPADLVVERLANLRAGKPSRPR